MPSGDEPTPHHSQRRRVPRPAVLALLTLLTLLTLVTLISRAPGDRPAPELPRAAAPSSSPAAERTPSAPAPSPPAAVVAARPTVLLESTPTRLRVPTLTLDSDLVPLGLEPDGALEVPTGAFPAGWYTGGPTPGELGPAIVAGHVDWKGAKGVFYELRNLKAGADIVIDRADGSTATFRVTGIEQFDKDAFPSERVYGDLGYAGLRLITCGGSFDRAARSYRDNIVVFAELVAPAAS